MPEPLQNPSTPQAIRIARVLCIFLVMYVHVNPGISEVDPAGQGVRAFDWARFTLVNSAGRVSVGLLSVVSGYLAVSALARAGFGRLIAKRVRTLIVPMALWSALFMAMAMVGERVQPGYLARTLGGELGLARLPDWLFGLTRAPANAPLAFLRDIFVCSLLLPVLLRAQRAGAWVYVGVVAAIFGLAWVSPLLLTPSLAPLFAIGVWIGVSGKLPRISGRLALVCVAVSLALGVWASFHELTYIAGGVEADRNVKELALTLIRVPAAMALWWLALALARVKVGGALAQLEPYIFTVFCSHMLVLTVLWFGWERSFGRYYDPAYPVFFVLAPVVSLAVGVVLAIVLGRLVPPVFALLNGGRGG
jgi:surface polysaccharide O-acyltransferase-like enzyme